MGYHLPFLFLSLLGFFFFLSPKNETDLFIFLYHFYFLLGSCFLHSMSSLPYHSFSYNFFFSYLLFLKINITETFRKVFCLKTRLFLKCSVSNAVDMLSTLLGEHGH